MLRSAAASAGLLAIGSLLACSGNHPAGPAAPAPAAAAQPPSASPPNGSEPATPTDVLTYKNDVRRSGANLTESVLTPTNVDSAGFGLLRVLPLDGKVDAQPLYVAGLTIAGTVHDVVYAASEHGSVFAFDAATGSKIWQVSLLGTGESPSDDHGCGQVTPEIGVTATPVIDRGAGPHGALYAVAMSKDSASVYHQRLHALDLASGAELFHGPADVAARYPNATGTVTFNAGQYVERAALLLSNGTLYTSWTSHCDSQPYSGWIMAFAGSTLAAGAVLNVGPNSAGNGPAIWMSGGGPAADAAGNVYLLTANGTFDTTLNASGFPARQDYGNSFLKLAAGAGSLTVADYFTMSNAPAESAADQDLGSGGAMLLPDLTDSSNIVRHLAIGAGKDGNLYLVDRDAMGRYSGTANNIWQQLDGAVPGGIWSTPAWFNDSVYYADAGGTLKAFPLKDARLAPAPSSQTAVQFAYPGTAPVVSANGTTNAIVWAHENAATAVLHAFDANNLAHELYNSNQAANGRDHFGAGNKFISPTVADGRVFVGTTSGVAVFGLLP